MGAAERESQWPRTGQKRSASELVVVRNLVFTKDMCKQRGVAFSVCFKRVNKVVIVASLTALRMGEGLKDGAIDGDYRPTMKAGRPKIFLMFFNSPNIQ